MKAGTMSKILVAVVTAVILGIPGSAWWFYTNNAWAGDIQMVMKSVDDWRIQDITNQLNELAAKEKYEGLTKYDEIRKARLERELKLLTGGK